MNKQSGFTLIELVMVIVILGILAATALPKFADLSGDARTASINGLAGGLRSTAAIVHAQALVDNQTGAGGSVTVEGTTVNTEFGYPATEFIDDALSDYSGFTFTAGTGTGTPSTFVLATNCQVAYTEPAAANGAPTITATTSGC